MRHVLMFGGFVTVLYADDAVITSETSQLYHPGIRTQDELERQL